MRNHKEFFLQFFFLVFYNGIGKLNSTFKKVWREKDRGRRQKIKEGSETKGEDSAFSRGENRQLEKGEDSCSFSVEKKENVSWEWEQSEEGYSTMIRLLLWGWFFNTSWRKKEAFFFFFLRISEKVVSGRDV